MPTTINLSVGSGETKNLTFNCGGTFVPDDIQFVITGSGGDTNTTLSGVAYCSTGASTTAKVATMPGFALSSGQRIILYLSTTNSKASATLNVNSTGAKTIKIGGSNTTTSNFIAGYWVCEYDGTNWNLSRLFADVKQDDTTTSSYRKVILSGNTYSSAETAVSATTGQTYATQYVEVQPSTGKIRSKGFVKASPTNATGILLADGTDIAQSTFATSGHTHNYLPLAGGTMDTNATITTKTNYFTGLYKGEGIKFTIPSTITGGWARGITLDTIDGSSTIIGWKGDNGSSGSNGNGFNNLYIGGTYSEPAIEVYKNKNTKFYGTATATGFVKSSPTNGATAILLANGNDIPQSTFAPAGNYKTTQTAVSDPTASSTTSTTFIDTISQNTNGVITATKKTLPAYLTAVNALSATPTATLSSSTLTFKQFSQATSAQVSQADSSTKLYFNSVPSSTNKIATMSDVTNAFQVNDAMVFKGTIGTGGTVTALPDTHYQGWTYKVTTAGTYAGKVCEVGDMIICVTDGTSADNSHWTVVQSNIDGAVTGPASAINNHIAVFNGTTGKIIKDSGFTIEKSVPGDAAFTDTDFVIILKSEGADPEKVGVSKSLDRLVIGHYFVLVNEDNTAQREISLTFGGVNSSTIYIDDKVSSAENWQLERGLYFAYFDGRFWYFERSGKIISNGFRTHGGRSTQFLKANGTVDSTSYLPRSGGQMTGPLTWANSTALPEQTNPQYVLTVDAFTNGGTTKWTSIDNLASAHTHTTSIQTSSDTNQITLGYGTKYSITAGGTSYVFTMPSLGTTSTTAAAGNHTHTTTVATSTGTSQLALGYGKKYSITAGGTSYIITTPELGTTSTTAAAGNHTHTTSIATSSSTSQITLGYGSKYSLSAGGTSYIFTMPSLGTTSTTAAAGNHTHTTTIATSTGTSQITLTHGGKFSITAGGTSYIFTMPSDSNTDTLVKQTVDETTTEYPILLSAQSAPTSGTAYESKYSNSLKATGSGDMVFQKSSDKCTLQFDNTLKCLNFIFE